MNRRTNNPEDAFFYGAIVLLAVIGILFLALAFSYGTSQIPASWVVG